MSARVCVSSPAVAAQRLQRSPVRALFDAAQRDPEVVRLEVGEPSFVTPRHIIDAAADAARAGHTHYGPNGGLLSLRELLAEKLRVVNRRDVAVDEIVVTPGGMNALFTIYLGLLDPGDEVLLPTPGFPNMDEMVRLVGGVPVFYSLHAANGYLPDPDQIEERLTRRTKILFVNTPGNPTGAVFPAELVERLVALTERAGIYMISDEVYDELVLDDDCTHVSAAPFAQGDGIITVHSFSKVYAMTGWRVGYLTAAPALAALFRTLQEPQVSCPSTISQKAAEAALVGPRGPIEEMRRAYRANRDTALEAAAALGLEVSATRGGFYMLVQAPGIGADSLAFAMDMLREQKVTMTPGVAFGPGAREMLRLSLAATPDAIRLGLHGLRRALDDRACR